MARPLSDQQRAFAQSYALSGDAEASVKAAGFVTGNAASMRAKISSLMRNARVVAFIDGQKETAWQESNKEGLSDYDQAALLTTVMRQGSEGDEVTAADLLVSSFDLSDRQMFNDRRDFARRAIEHGFESFGDIFGETKIYERLKRRL